MVLGLWALTEGFEVSDVEFGVWGLGFGLWRWERFCSSKLVLSTHRLHSGFFLGFIFRILQGNPKKELLGALWVSTLDPTSVLVVFLEPWGSVG